MPVHESSDFDREYFLQTRREIDTEKRERDHLLNFAVVILGALAFAVVQSDKAKQFLQEPYSLMFEISTLIILTSLFWVRRKKLQQISDRWYTLYHMALRNMSEEWMSQSMEAVVINGFFKARYIRKDLALNVALSLPIYTLVFVSSLRLPFHLWLSVITGVLIVTGHLTVSWVLLAKKLIDAFPVEIETKDGRATGCT
jgi:hypothetical protein